MTSSTLSLLSSGLTCGVVCIPLYSSLRTPQPSQPNPDNVNARLCVWLAQSWPPPLSQGHETSLTRTLTPAPGATGEDMGTEEKSRGFTTGAVDMAGGSRMLGIFVHGGFLLKLLAAVICKYHLPCISFPLRMIFPSFLTWSSSTAGCHSELSKRNAGCSSERQVGSEVGARFFPRT